jgi:hypothetical protein
MQLRSSLFLILLAANCLGGTWMASPGKGSHGAGGGVSINQWYYAGTGNNDTSFTSTSTGGFALQSFTYGATVAIPASGTLTHLSFNGVSGAGSTDFKIAIFDAGNNLVASGSQLGVSGTPGWFDVDVADTAVTAQSYKVMISASTANGLFGYDATENGISSTVAYASFPPSPLGSTSVETNVLPAVRAFVTNKPIATLRSMSSTTYTSRTNTTLTAPTGITNGDVLILAFFIGASGTPPTPTLPAGFTVIQGPTTQNDGSFQGTRRLAWKIASGESGSYSITHSAGSSQAVMLCVQNAASSTPVSSSNGGSGFTTTATGITTAIDQSLIIFLVHNWALYGSGAVPTGTTPVFTEQLDSATSLFYVATGTLGTAGATGDKTQANGNGGAGDQWGAFLVGVGGGP